MKIGVLGSGMVGRALASRLIELGHLVCMGSREAAGPAAQWASAQGERASSGDYRDAAEFGELVVNATAGQGSLAALRQASAEHLDGKVLLDVANPINTSGGGGALSVANNDSLAEVIQREFPDARVVKSLNTMNCEVMVRPEIVPGDHVVFLSSDHRTAKDSVAQLLETFRWPRDRIIDLGGLSTARGTEALLLLWLPVWQALGRAQFNWAINRAPVESHLG